MKYFKYIALIIILISSTSYAQDIIPEPEYSLENGQHFSLNPQTKIYYGTGLLDQAKLLDLALSPATGWDLQINQATKNTISNGILLKLDEHADLDDEGYSLNVENDRVEIIAKKPAGIFYGIQSLLQLLPVEIYNTKRQKQVNWTIKAIAIKDNPQYAWRGMMLDVSRYFFGKKYVLKFIDMMSMYKLNVLHLHLIDDAGWRLEIKKYPRLTSVGAWRGEGPDRTGGYYTQEDIKEIIQYASIRNVDVIPEIELPAHTLAAIAAYPHLSCKNEDLTVPVKHFISRDLYCVGKETTFEFLEDVFKEVFELFPSKYIHIGGDEAKYDRWKACPHCQKRKKDLGLEYERDLQVYFNKRIQDFVQKHGKTIVGWDEIIQNGLTDKAVGMIWYDTDKTFEATKAGHDVVMALTGYCYFDVAESNISGEVKAATWLPPISLEKVYKFNPMIPGLETKFKPQVLGGHACLWSDQFINGTILQEINIINENRSEKYFDYLTFPRMSALAEVLWSPLESLSWDRFENKMRTHYNRYDEAGYGYRVPQPKLISKKQENGKYIIHLENLVAGAEIRYSTNGLSANVYSSVYTKPIVIESLSGFEAITVVNRLQYSLPLNFPNDYKDYKKYGSLLKEWNPSTLKTNGTAIIEMNASGKIDKNKSYEVSFWQLEGTGSMEILSIEVYKNGKKIAEDIHTGKVAEISEKNIFTFKIDAYETGAAFTIKATIKSEMNKNSYGAVFIK